MTKPKLKIRKNDIVKVLSGKDKGKTGKVIKVYPAIMKVVVEGINLHTRFEKSKKAGKPGQKIVFPAPFIASKVQLIDESSGQPTRLGYAFLENGSKQRVARKSGKAV